MSRESLLDEAITKAKECEDWQLVEWLRMARGGENAARWYTAKLSEARLDISNLMTENAKLRNEFRKMDEWHSKELLAAVDNNKKLRELVADMYAYIKVMCSMVENSPGCSMCLTNQDEERPCAAADVYCRMTELGVYE